MCNEQQLTFVQKSNHALQQCVIKFNQCMVLILSGAFVSTLVVESRYTFWPPSLGTISARNKGKLQKLSVCNSKVAHKLCLTTAYYTISHTQFVTLSLWSSYMIFHVELQIVVISLCPCQCLYSVWGRDKMDAISQTTFSSTFSWMKMFEFRLKFHWSLFLRVELTIFQHWFR